MSDVNCIIVHGCPSDNREEKNKEYAGHWIPWVRTQLIARGIPTRTPLIPAPWHPKYEAFKKTFETGRVTEETVLIGHSCGCAFLVRWLGETKRKVRKLILVAPWKVSKPGDAWRDAFYGYTIDSTIKDRVNEIVMFTSDTEVQDGKKSLAEYHDVLGGRIIELKHKGHYMTEHMGSTEFPELIGVVME